MQTANTADPVTMLGDATRQAIEALGTTANDDYVLQPGQHAAALPDAAGPLKRILQRSQIEEIGRTYEDADAKAVEAQARYKTLARFAARTGFGSVAVALVLFWPEHDPSWDWVFALGYLLEIGLLAASFLASRQLSQTKSFDTWMQERARAETNRVQLFATVAAANEETRPSEISALPLQLEYVRRYQLDVQRAYYRKRGKDHKRDAANLGIYRYIVIGLGVLGLVPAFINLREVLWPFKSPDGMLHTMEPYYRGLAERIFHSSGLLGGALQTLLATHEEQAHNIRNADRYEVTGNNLDHLSEVPLADARAAAVRGDRANVINFAKVRHDQISKEHSEWLTAHAINPSKPLDQQIPPDAATAEHA